MPAISISFNRYLLLLLLQISLIPAAWGQLPQFEPQQMKWLGERVFANECNSNFSCLTSWNEGEDFPSLGIGHFIWYRAHQAERFEETFPALLEFYVRNGYQLPQWLRALDGLDSPWQDRQQFLADLDSPRMNQLRTFLGSTIELQVLFIVERLHGSVDALFEGLDPTQRSSLQTSFYEIANSQAPYGMYALIDYVHFKGTGIAPSERYQGQGWGLLQVLLELEGSAANLENFVSAATRVLERRVANAPIERAEQRWIAGWTNRLQTYLPKQ
ncbi:MAG: hypothetical protein DHS20C12_12390 [Pseudohongiella sp.]|nr:MAG: hypothetical protein DHS20C12_12390 [Pseudohongiella sp.]